MRLYCIYFAVEELRVAARMYETELRTKLAVAVGLRSILGMEMKYLALNSFPCLLSKSNYIAATNLFLKMRCFADRRKDCSIRNVPESAADRSEMQV